MWSGPSSRESTVGVPIAGQPIERPSFEAVYRDHARYVFRVLRRFGVAACDVEDVCQEVFVVVHRKLPEFAQRSSVRTWLYGIALRTASDYRRRAYVVRETMVEVDVTVDPTQPDAVARREARALLDAIIDRLDDDQRAVFVLFELEELTMAEVAEIVDCPLKTAYSRLYAARAAVESAMTRMRAGGAS